jgi:hypothetical protein
MSGRSKSVDWVLLALVIAYNVLMAGATAAFCIMTYLAIR